MSGEINDQTEQYQRGQVLGFTMAEIMLVLIFLLLLLLGTQLQQTQDKLESAYAPDSPEYQAADKIKETLANLKTSKVIPEDKNLLWLTETLTLSAKEMIKNPKDDTNIIQNLEKKILVLEAELTVQKELIAKTDIETLKEEVEVLASKLEEEQKKYQAINLPDLDTGRFFTDILKDQNISSLEAKQCLLTCGGGPKACWGESLKNPDYIYNVALYEDSIFITNNPENIKKNKADWVSLLQPARIEEPILLTNAQFRSRFTKLKEHAVVNECVYQVRLVDVFTSSKAIYKKQRQLVEAYVYPTNRKSWNYGTLPK